MVNRPEISAPRGQVFPPQPMGHCLEGRHPVSPMLLTSWVWACRQPSYSYVCGPLPRPLGACPRETRSRLRPMEQCFNRTFSSLRPQPHSRSPRSLPSEGTLLFLGEDWLGGAGSAFHMRVRGPAKQAESTDTERFKETTGLLLSAREAGLRTELPDKEALERRDREVLL